MWENISFYSQAEQKTSEGWKKDASVTLMKTRKKRRNNQDTKVHH